MTTINGTLTSIQSENMRLQQRVQELEQETTQLRQQIEETRQHTMLNRDQEFLDRGPLVFFVWDCAPGWPVTYVSPNVMQLLGYRDTDFTSGRVAYSSVVHPDDLERVAAEVQAYSQAHVESFEQEYRLVHTNGATRWIYDFTLIQRDNQGAITQYYGYILDITKRKQAEDALHQSQQMLQLIIDNLPVAVFWKDWDLTYQGCNQMFATSAGIGATANIIGKSDYDMPWKREEMEWYRQVDRRIMENDHPEYHIIEPIHHADGTQSWLDTSKIPLHNASGNVIGVLGTYEDITERKQAEQALLMSQFALDHASDGVEWVDSTGQFLYVNETSCTSLGYTHDELLTMRISDIDPLFPSERWAATWERVKQAGSLTFETVHRRKDGSTFPVEVSVTYQELDAKEFLFAFTRDISERKRWEEELRMFKALAENSPDAIAIAATDGVITYANPAFRAMFGYGEATLGMINTTLFTSDDQHGGLPAVLVTVANEGSWTGILTGQRKDGTTFPVQLAPFALRDSAGQILSLPCILRDMTAQQQAEEERAALQEQLITSQRAAIRELSTPLLPLADHVLVLPLIGTLDSTRAGQVMETLLHGVATHQAAVVIVDITGVKVVDTQVAQAIIRTAQAVRLLGAQVVLTGIQPLIAQTLVHLGVELQGIVTQNTLQAGIAYAMRQHGK